MLGELLYGMYTRSNRMYDVTNVFHNLKDRQRITSHNNHKSLYLCWCITSAICSCSENGVSLPSIGEKSSKSSYVIRLQHKQQYNLILSVYISKSQ